MSSIRDKAEERFGSLLDCENGGCEAEFYADYFGEEYVQFKNQNVYAHYVAEVELRNEI
jgi:hypothetical protein